MRGWPLAVTLAWASHVLFDWLGSDTTPPLGVMALWPFSSEYYFSNAFFFEAISRRYWLDNFISHNLWAVTREILILGPRAGRAYCISMASATPFPPPRHSVAIPRFSPRSFSA